MEPLLTPPTLTVASSYDERPSLNKVAEAIKVQKKDNHYRFGTIILFHLHMSL
jgi:hypothetical protein